jgi:hypothetical protein
VVVTLRHPSALLLQLWVLLVPGCKARCCWSAAAADGTAHGWRPGATAAACVLYNARPTLLLLVL